MTEAALRDEARVAEARTSFELPGGPSAAAKARAMIAPLRQRLGDSVTGDLALLLSELVTNSYRHSGAAEAGISVSVEVRRDHVRAEITDHGKGPRAEPVPEEQRGEGGWGLVIVDRLSRRWGVRKGPPSCVWFELAR
jgi:anti-sigma regulatory factor (Ser/Thr protein kinase)